MVVGRVQMQVIQSWSVAGVDRLVGEVFVPGKSSGGRTVITSRVKQVIFKGSPLTPVAVTASGSEYWLGTPSEKVRGDERPEEFVARKNAAPRSEEDADASGGSSADGATTFIPMRR